MQFTSLIDPGSVALVLGGTVLATVLRAGWQDLDQTLRALAALVRPRFSADQAKADLARASHGDPAGRHPPRQPTPHRR